MQAGRLTEVIEIISTRNGSLGYRGDSVVEPDKAIKLRACVKLEKSDYIDDLGGYYTDMDIVCELHYHNRRAVLVGDLIRRGDTAVTGVSDGSGGSVVTTYEVTSVEPNRSLNRVYIRARRLKVEAL